MDNFDIILKELRISKNITQKEVADFLNVSESTYANWEQGRREPSLNMLKKIAEYFDVSTDYLVGLETDDMIYVPIAARTGNRGGTYITKEDADLIRKELEGYEETEELTYTPIAASTGEHLGKWRTKAQIKKTQEEIEKARKEYDPLDE